MQTCMVNEPDGNFWRSPNPVCISQRMDMHYGAGNLSIANMCGYGKACLKWFPIYRTWISENTTNRGTCEYYLVSTAECGWIVRLWLCGQWNRLELWRSEMRRSGAIGCLNDLPYNFEEQRIKNSLKYILKFRVKPSVIVILVNLAITKRVYVSKS